MTSRSWIRKLFARTPRPTRKSPARCRPAVEALEGRLAPAVLLTYGGPVSVLSLTEQVSGATPTVTISESSPTTLKIDLGVGNVFDASSTGSATGLTWSSGTPTASQSATIDVGTLNNVTALQAALAGDTLNIGGIADLSGGVSSIAASAAVINVGELRTATANPGTVDLKATGALTVASGAVLDSGTGTISLAADVKPDGTGDDGVGTLTIQSGAVVYSASPSSTSITLRGADMDIAGLVSKLAPGGLPPSTTLTGLDHPPALAFDARGNLFVANHSNGTVSVFAPGSTTPSKTLTRVPSPDALAFDASGFLFVTSRDTNTVSVVAPGDPAPIAYLTGLNGPGSLAFDASGNLFVANSGNGTVSVFAPGDTTPSKTLRGLSFPEALAFDASGNLFVANFGNGTVSVFAPGSTTPTKTLTGLAGPQALAFDASGNLFVANAFGNTVSVFAPGSTTPSKTLTGLNGPGSLAFDASGNLYVANKGDGTVSVFAPGDTTPTTTLTGLNDPRAMAIDASGNLFVANYVDSTVSMFAARAPQPGGVVIQSSLPTRPMLAGDTSSPVAGINLSNAELARIRTAATGSITFGDPAQSGNITFKSATPAATAGPPSSWCSPRRPPARSSSTTARARR
jgi:sugar lactone lactonase YvrE